MHGPLNVKFIFVVLYKELSKKHKFHENQVSNSNAVPKDGS